MNDKIILEPNFNGLPKPTDWSKVIVPLQQVNEKEFCSATLSELGDQMLKDKTINGQRMKAVAPGPLPAGPDNQEMYMVLETSGTWTYNGDTFANFEYQTLTLWWNKITWSVENINHLPRGKDGRDITDWEAKAYAYSAVTPKVSFLVFKDGAIWENNSATLASDIPGVSPLWTDKTGSGKFVEYLENNEIPEAVFSNKITVKRRNITPLTGVVVTTTNDNNVVSDAINVYKGDIIEGYLLTATTVLQVANYNKKGVFVDGMLGTNSYTKFTYVVKETGTVRLGHFISVAGDPIAVRIKREIYQTSESDGLLKKHVINKKYLKNVLVRDIGGLKVSNKTTTKNPLENGGDWDNLVISPLESKVMLSLSEVGATGMYSSSFKDDTGLWTLGVTKLNLYIYRDGIEFIKIPNATIGISVNVNFSSVGVFEGKVHLLIANYLLTNSTNGLENVVIDIATKEVTHSKVLIEGNSVVYNYNQVFYKGNLYASVNTSNLIVDNKLVVDNANLKISILKLISGVWTLVSTPVVSGEEWGETFKNSTGTVTRGVNLVFPTKSSLFVHNDTLYLNYVSVNGVWLGLQKTSSDGISFVKKRMFPSDQQTGYALNGISYKGSIYYITNTFYINNLAQHKILSMFNEDFSKRTNFEIIGSADFATNVIVSGDLMINTSSYFTSATRGQLVIDLLNFKNWVNHLDNIEIGEHKGYLTPTKMPDTIKEGDFYVSEIDGNYPNLKNKVTFLTGNSPTNYNLSVNRGERASLVYNGFGFWAKKSNYILSNQRSVVCARGAANNLFNSSASRLPVVLEDKNGRIITLFDIRYTSGDDYDSIDIGSLKSYDNGRTWIDNAIVMKRSPNDGWRLHDPSAVLDKNTGRIWAIGKQWEDITSPFTTGFWSANRDKMRLYITYSDDNGLSWSPRVDVTDLKMPSAWHISSGCGAGIQLQNGTLLMPIYEVETNGTQYSNFIYKTPDSDEWKKPFSKGALGGNECQIIEDNNGDLYLLQRRQGVKALFVMKGGIAGEWEIVPTTFVFKEPAGGAFSAFVKYNNTYIFAGAQSGGSSARTNITVFYSTDLISWHQLTQITDYVSQGYTSILVTNNNFGSIFEDKNFSLSYQSLENFRNILR